MYHIETEMSRTKVGHDFFSDYKHLTKIGGFLVNSHRVKVVGSSFSYIIVCFLMDFDIIFLGEKIKAVDKFLKTLNFIEHSSSILFGRTSF